MITHPFPPIYDCNSRILILGSFPSVQSRQSGFYYGNPQNRFWRVLAAVFNCGTPETVAEKTAFLLARRIALWDAAACCEITGSSDATLRSAVPNDIASLLASAPVEHIYTNGRTAHRLYSTLIYPSVLHEAVCLPSTSPANASWSIERLCTAWGVLGTAPDAAVHNP